MQKTHSKINYCAAWITSSTTAAVFQRKGLITHLRDWLTVLRPQYSDPFLVHPCLNWNLFQKIRGRYSLMQFQNCVICTTTDIARVKSAVRKTSGEKGIVWETESYQEGGEYKSMCTSMTQQQRSHFLHCRTTQCVPASCISLQPSQNRTGQIEKVTCLLCS